MGRPASAAAPVTVSAAGGAREGAAMSVVPAVVKRAELGQLGDPVAGQSGESIGIWRTGNGLLFKEYKETAVLNGRPEALAHLVAVGRGEAPVYRADREVLLAAPAWPVARGSGPEGDPL